MNSRFFKYISILFIMCASGYANAYGYGSTSTYSSVTWSFSHNINGLSSMCNQLRVDLTGDIFNSKSMIVYGALNCPALNSGYPATGSAYFSDGGSFNMNLTLGNGFVISCGRVYNFSGSCNIYNSSGQIAGTGYANFN